MYDGASSAAEGVLMARRLTGRPAAVLCGALHPHYAETISCYLSGLAKPGEELMAIVDTYLADSHVKAAEHGLGCAIAAAGSDVPRQQAEVRSAVSRRIRDLIGTVERQLPDWSKEAAHEKAMGVVATMVGALMLARASDDAQLSKAIRKAARDLVREVRE